MSFMSGIVDARDQVHLGGYPAPFRDLLGLVVEEWAPYLEDATNTVRTTAGAVFACRLWSDVIRLEGAEALATYTDDFFAGTAAVTRHRFGRGTGLYVGTELDGPGVSWLIEQACGVAGVLVDTRTPADIEIVRRTRGDEGWTFLLNHSADPVELDLDLRGIDVLSGTAVAGSLRMEARGVSIIRTPSAVSV